MLNSELKALSVLAVMLLLVPSSAQAQNQDFPVSGTVVNIGGGDPIPGASVLVKGTTIGTSTGAEGRFELEATSPRDTLVISYVGYSSKEVLIDGREDVGIVELNPATVQGEEVVVVGFGEQKKISVVGAVQSIQSPEEELRTSAGNLSNSFAGQLAGVTAFQRSGEPGANAAEFYIRGISTFSGATSPLIIIDGVQASQGDLNALAPEVIESFSILKDATATAVYGSRGANGVMVVETKSGRNLDEPVINVRMENAVTTPTSVPDFVGAPRYMELFNEAVQTRNTGEILYLQDQIDGAREGRDPYVYPNVDWYEELFKNYSMQQTLNLNIRGGGERLGYFSSATFYHNNGMLKTLDINSFDTNLDVKRYSFQNNLNYDFTPTTNLSLKLNAKIRDYHGPDGEANGIFNTVTVANPADFPIRFPADTTGRYTGTTRWGSRRGGIGFIGYENPVAEMTNGYQDNFQSTVLATAQGTQELGFLTEGLSARALASFKNWSWTDVTRSRLYNQFTVDGYNQLPDGSYNYDVTRISDELDETLNTYNNTGGDRRWYFEGRLQYDRTFADRHNVSSMLLVNRDEFNVNAPGGLIESLPQRTLGYAGRLRYAYDDTYLAELNFGYNGSENFAGGQRFGFFPSAALGYVVSNEDYWDPVRSVVNLLKVRGSWGFVGNDEIGGQRFVYLSDVNLYGTGYTTGRGQNYGRSGPVYNRFANNGITWEVGEKINIGVDLALFESLNITANFFQENRRDIFLQRSTIPASTGTAGTDIFGNLGEVTNRGMDLAVDFSGSLGGGVYAALKGTFTYAHNEVDDIDEPPYLANPNLSQVGNPIGALYGLKAERLFIDQAEIDASPEQQLGGFTMPGDIKYEDVNGDGFVNNDDRVKMGHPTIPEITYGFGPSFFYKNIDFSFLMQGVARTSFFVGGIQPFGATERRNVYEFISQGRWSEENPDIYADYPRLSKLENPNNTVASSYWLRDGSFLKLRNVELGYRWQMARFYLSGRNLLIFSPFDLWDPERGGGNGFTYPTQRVVNVGVQLNF